MVGDEGGVCREGQFGNWASAVAGVQPALDGGAVEGVAGREDDGVGHDLQGKLLEQQLHLFWLMDGLSLLHLWEIPAAY